MTGFILVTFFGAMVFYLRKIYLRALEIRDYLDVMFNFDDLKNVSEISEHNQISIN